MKVRFGVSLGTDVAHERLAGMVDHLESTGVDSLWFSELVYSPAVEPFVGMTYALARTTRLKVGTSVVVLPGRHPVLVAKQLASLAALAPKRVLPVFGLRSALPAERAPGEIRDRGAEGESARFEPGDLARRLGFIKMPQLGDEARLAQTGLADDRDHRAPPVGQHREFLAQ